MYTLGRIGRTAQRLSGWLSPILATLFALAALLPAPVYADGCTYVLGFKTLHDAIPATVGACVDNEGPEAIPQPNGTAIATGNRLQHTEHGLLVWRSSDNWTAFTDGYRTWVNGPNGIQERLNTQRFPWEKDKPSAPLPPVPAPTPPPAAPTSPPALYPNGDGNPADVVPQARALLCSFDSGGVCSLSADTVLFANLGTTGDLGFTNPMPLLGQTKPIYLDDYFLTAPISETATVYLHESRHQWDFGAHLVMRQLDPRGFCYFTESNAMTEMTRFWLWLYPNGGQPADAFSAIMAQQVQLLNAGGGQIDVHSWPAYQRECG